MLDQFLNKKRNVYLMALAAIFCESFSSVFLKLAGQQPVLGWSYIFYYGCAVAVMGKAAPDHGLPPQGRHLCAHFYLGGPDFWRKDHAPADCRHCNYHCRNGGEYAG